MKMYMLAMSCLLLTACNNATDNKTVRRDPTTGQTTDAKPSTVVNKPVVDPVDNIRTPTSEIGPKMTAEKKPAVDKDNTVNNKIDRDSNLTKTPIDQNENRNDIAISASIRKQVVDTKMSITAQNVIIITADGKVTLRGTVKSDEEKQRIEAIAKEVAGNTNVDNQIAVEDVK